MISNDSGAVFAAVFAALYAAHQVADHWVQTQCQSDRKGLPGWVGRLACARHVTTYTATALGALLAVASVTGLHLAVWPTTAGLAVSAVTHYVADRRTPLRWMADKLAWIGKPVFFRLGVPRAGHDDNPSLGTGSYALDQSWHIGWLFVAALVIAS
jgi:hypothetical protein